MLKNFLLVTWGSSGDILPFIGVGVELKRRGHDVTLVANAHYERQATAAGLSFAAAGSEADYDKLMADSQLWDWQLAFERANEHWGPSIELSYDAILKRHRPGATVLVGSVGAVGAHLAQERLGVPFAWVVHIPFFLRSRCDPPYPARPLPGWAHWFGGSARRLSLLYTARNYARALQDRFVGNRRVRAQADDVIQAVRARLGFPAESTVLPELIIGAWPDWFAAPQRDWPRQAAVTGFPFYPPLPSGAEMDAPEAGEASPIVFTTGSLAGSQREFFTMAAGACEILRRPGVLVSPHADHIPAPLPPGVTHVQFAPFGTLFRGAAAVVHHGGIGTAAYALAAGAPQIIKPMVGEQFDTGNRLERLGVGKMIAERDIGPARMARILRSLLGSRRVRSRCRYWRSRVDPHAGLQRTADLIETLAPAAS